MEAVTLWEDALESLDLVDEPVYIDAMVLQEVLMEDYRNAPMDVFGRGRISFLEAWSRFEAVFSSSPHPLIDDYRRIRDHLLRKPPEAVFPINGSASFVEILEHVSAESFDAEHWEAKVNDLRNVQGEVTCGDISHAVFHWLRELQSSPSSTTRRRSLSSASQLFTAVGRATTSSSFNTTGSSSSVYTTGYSSNSQTSDSQSRDSDAVPEGWAEITALAEEARAYSAQLAVLTWAKVCLRERSFLPRTLARFVRPRLLAALMHWLVVVKRHSDFR